MKRNSDGNVVMTKQPHEQDEPYCGDTSDFVAKDGHKEDNVNQMFECQVDEAAEFKSDVAGKQELMEEPVSANPETNIDFHEEVQCLKDTGEEKPMEKYEANVDAPAAAMEVIGQEELIEEYEVDYAEAIMESEAHSLQPLFLSY
ncbi:hypothetical protein KY285_001588 [Solanum tuberosum]|nr:hypothetical protein KY289_004252 [Solanum tuberosum]KAH0765717.1 hypothetical protein KY285_001588 [Solanum tuberosum]